jgi:hypothetical protein
LDDHIEWGWSEAIMSNNTKRLDGSWSRSHRWRASWWGELPCWRPKRTSFRRRSLPLRFRRYLWRSLRARPAKLARHLSLLRLRIRLKWSIRMES